VTGAPRGPVNRYSEGDETMKNKLLFICCLVVVALAIMLVGDWQPVSGGFVTTHVETGGLSPYDVPFSSRAVVWDNDMTYVGIAASQYDDQIDPILDPIVADDFIFAVDQIVNDVHWVGGYWNGPPDDGNFDWEIKFYDDDPTGAGVGTEIASYLFANPLVSETFLDSTAGTSYYSYSVDLPSDLTFLAATKYWISIQGIGQYAPQSGVAFHQVPITLNEAMFKSDYFGQPNWVPGFDVFGYSMDLCFRLTFEERCDWQPGQPHKMHWAQLPDEDGWAVNATAPVVLADDFMCMETGYIKDIHFWGAWRNGVVGQVNSFVLSLHSDIPADPPQVPYSRPGITLWELEVTDWDVTPIDPPTLEGWYDPAQGFYLPDDHLAYFQYNVCLDSLDWFEQQEGTIYWLNISAVVEDPQGTEWGWKSTEDHWNDDAVWAFWGELNWIEMYEPADGDAILNPFYVVVDGFGNVIDGAGGDAYGLGWYFYPMEDWWNIWFYDHPFTYDRYKTVHIEIDAFPFEPGASFIELAVNWSTDLWSLDQPVGDSAPPLPGEDEFLYIGRHTLLASDVIQGHYVFDYTIPDYNPEWVSIDIRGFNFIIPEGFIEHTCVGQQSLDLAFVITGGPGGGCDAVIGDANGSGVVDIDDVVYLIAYIFSGGPPPTPYPLASGDADCSCFVDIDDAVYLIAYIFGGGPPPCDCPTWLSICGPPLR